MRDIDTIYDKEGEAALRLLKGGRLVDFLGKSIGFLHTGSVYDYNGIHRGWYTGGVLRDHEGNCVGFGQRVTDTHHPILPMKSIQPTPNITEIEPLRPIREISPVRPVSTFQWSDYNPVSLFMIYPE